MSSEFPFASAFLDRCDRLTLALRRSVDEFAELATRIPRDWEGLSTAAWTVCDFASRTNLCISAINSNERQRSSFKHALQDFVRASSMIVAELPADLDEKQREKLTVTNSHCADRLKSVECREAQMREEFAAVTKLLSSGRR